MSIGPSFHSGPGNTSKVYGIYRKMKNFTLIFDSWTTGKHVANTRNEYQVDIGSAAIIISLEFEIGAHQTTTREVFGDTNNIRQF